MIFNNLPPKIINEFSDEKIHKMLLDFINSSTATILAEIATLPI